MGHIPGINGTISTIGDKYVVYHNGRISTIGDDYVVYESNDEDERSQIQPQLVSHYRSNNNFKPGIHQTSPTFFAGQTEEQRKKLLLSYEAPADRGIRWGILKENHQCRDEKGNYFFNEAGWRQEIEDEQKKTGEYQVYRWQQKIISNYTHGQFITQEKDEYIKWFRAPSESRWIDKRNDTAIVCFFLCINPDEMTEKEYQELWTKRNKVGMYDIDVMVFQHRLKQMDELDSRKSCFESCRLF